MGTPVQAIELAVGRASRHGAVRGILVILAYGVTLDLLILVLPTLPGRHVLSFLAVMVVSAVVESIAGHFFRRVGPKIEWSQERSRLLSGTGKGLLASAVVAAVYYVVYLIIHPVLLAGALLLPGLLKRVVAAAALVLMALVLMALVWIKMIYPPMSRGIESLPALAGKIATWIVVLLLVCDAALTGAAMVRYNVRAVNPEPANAFEQFLDRQYGDRRIEERWPNMIVTQGQ